MSMKIRKLKDRDGNVYTPLVSVDSVYYGSSSIKDTLLGSIQGPASSTDAHVVVFNGTSGKSAKDSGFTIAKSVPSDAKFTDTTYGAGTGLSLSGTTFNHSDSVIAGTAGQSTASSGVSLQVPYVTFNDTGHITAVGTHTHTVPNFIKSGATAASGLVPTPPTTAGTSKYLREDGSWETPPDTKYTGDNGISLSGTTFSNSGVRGVSSGSSNGTISVNTNGTSAEVSVAGWSTKADLASPTFTGTPIAPTAATGTNTTQIATTAFVKSEIDSVLQASDAMRFKGTIGTTGTVTTLPDKHSQGDTYKVITAGTYAGVVCEVGDMIICLKDGTEASNSDWTVVQGNIDGAVTGPASSVSGDITLFSGSTGKVVSDSGITVTKSSSGGDTTYTLTFA